jgi:hypothetical protein
MVTQSRATTITGRKAKANKEEHKQPSSEQSAKVGHLPAHRARRFRCTYISFAQISDDLENRH